MKNNNLVCVDTEKKVAVTDDNLKYIFVTEFNEEAISKFFLVSLKWRQIRITK